VIDTQINNLVKKFKQLSQPVHTEKWQGIPVSDKPEAAMQEQLFVDFVAPIQTEDLDELSFLIGPNLPWADDHFIQERVSGHPKNPGETWKYWPWGLAADKHRTEGERFNHTYAERYWPKHAGNLFEGGILPKEPVSTILHGIRYDYGDLNDLVDLLAREPNTRQAYLPIFFPEDTGVVHGSRVPCTLGYHFIHRNGFLHLVYYIRSCDIYRHFRDDVYLTVRLLLWTLDRLRERDSEWRKVKPGFLRMHITSLHCFVNDFRML
jgi:hypothetical protein